MTSHKDKSDKASAQVREACCNSIAVRDVIDELLLRQPPFMCFADSRKEILVCCALLSEKHIGSKCYSVYPGGCHFDNPLLSLLASEATVHTLDPDRDQKNTPDLDGKQDTVTQ